MTHLPIWKNCVWSQNASGLDLQTKPGTVLWLQILLQFFNLIITAYFTQNCRTEIAFNYLSKFEAKNNLQNVFGTICN